MKSTLLHLLWAIVVLSLLWFTAWCTDCAATAGRLGLARHGIECLPQGH